MAEPDKTAGGRLDYYLASVRDLLKRDVANLLPGHDLPVLSAARIVLEQTYESLMMKAIGIEEQTSWMSGATALVEKGLLEEAVFCCDRELALHPDDSRALQLKALCLNDLGRFDEALFVMDHLVRLTPAPNDPFVHLARGYPSWVCTSTTKASRNSMPPSGSGQIARKPTSTGAWRCIWRVATTRLWTLPSSELNS